ncbi:Uma2 family endonuclease [Chamaesiphon sp.]|uniref:Uma2 family endonuclease n=1 Tax=Chamaesiphon sp. TaxID=2814140 RepID=UPI0035945E54
MTLTTAKWTLAEYHQLVETGMLDNKRVELLEGIIVEMPPEGMPHAVYCTESVQYLSILLANRAKVREGNPITLPNDSEPEPDIAIVRTPNRQYLTHHPYPADIFWLIEYANTTLRKDITEKKRVYAEAGIEEYWVVNLQTPELILFRDLASDTYQSERRLATGNISPLSFPDIQIDVTKLFTV